VTGALTAARLAERGFDVVLFEKAAIGNGSSSRSMAGIRAQYATPEEVAELLVWLASPANSLVVGQVIFADGGAEALGRGDRVW
jgi:glycine/D-amino acid oxidase-like deaminating enzyme